MPKKPFGVLIFHGFTDRLDSIHIIESAVAALGVPVRAPVLRGHEAESPEALRGVTWQDWVADAESALGDLLRETHKVIVIGYSLGGLVALTLAAEHPQDIDSIVLAAAPVQINSPLAPGGPLHFLVSLIKRLVKKWDAPPVYVDKERIKYHTSYPWAPVDSIASLLDFSVAVRNRLSEVSVPALILQSHNDSTATPKSANIIYDTISTPSNEKEIVWFEKTEHEMFRDLEREGVTKSVVDYVKKRVEPRPHAYV
jgi:carboxylesterase